MTEPEEKEDSARKWRQFSAAIVAVLAASILTVLAAAAVVTVVQLGGLIRSEQAQRAMDRARSISRLAFVPVTLEDSLKLEQIAAAYEDTLDLVSFSISDARGRELVSRQARKSPERKWEVEASQPILPPREARGAPARAEPVGFVKITLDLSRLYGRVGRSLLWVVAGSALLFLLALAVDLALIVRMTRRLEELVGEARMAEELRRSNRELEQFAFVASHDLQEPLRKVVGYCQMLERRYHGKLDHEADEIIRVIMDGGTRMRDLIKDLLTYARVGTQGKPLRPTDCAAVLRETLASLQPAIEESGAKVTEQTLPVVLADPVQLGQLFQNLIGNAIKFRGGKPPEIRVAARRDDGHWRFCVSDNGIGIEPKHQERVFEMFRRLHSKEEYPGTGIGLAVCKKIVERHGGRIWIESAPGQGTSFYFTLTAGERT